PGRSPTRVGTAESAVRALAAATAAGAILGVVIGGVGGRIAMGFLASLNPEDKGVISDDGFQMGRITLGGTAQFLLTALQFGLIAGLIYLALRSLAIGPRWVRIASLTAGGTVVFGALVIHDGVDFTLLQPAWLPVVLFLAIPLIYIPAAGILTERWLRPTSWFNTADKRKVAAVLLVWIATGVLVLLAAFALAAAFVAREAVSHLSASTRSAGAWAARAVLGAIGVVALLALISDVNTYA
ncbi:MAG: hypothetical protein ABIQ15_00970, partial [Nocardioides sp.]